MKTILTQIVDRLSDLGASVDALEAALVANGGLRTGDVGNHFRTHKEIVETHLASLRIAIAALQE